MYDDHGLAGAGGLIAAGGYMFDMTQIMIVGAAFIVVALLLVRLARRGS
jgi:hypothetical protein